MTRILSLPPHITDATIHRAEHALGLADGELVVMCGQATSITGYSMTVLRTVIDSAIDDKHPDLAGAIADRYDALGGKIEPHTHGTGMAGAIAARTRGRWPDSAIRFFSTLTFSLPWFALGVLAIILFGVVLDWLPIFGRFSAGTVYEPTTGFVLVDAFVQWDFSLVVPWLEHLALPALTLGLTMTGFLTRITRAAILETMAEPYVRTARMVGLNDREILVHHVMRNASIPILTVAGLQFGALLGGAVITEVVFAYPGVGSLLVTAILQRDYFVAQGAALAVGLMFTVVSGLVDVGALALDPRLRHAT